MQGWLPVALDQKDFDVLIQPNAEPTAVMVGRELKTF